MNALCRRIPYRILKGVEYAFLALFPTLAVIATYFGFTRQHTMFFVAAGISLLYEFLMYMFTARQVSFKYSLILHGHVSLLILALFVIGFEFYGLGTFLVYLLGMAVALYLLRISLGASTFRAESDEAGTAADERYGDSIV